MKFIWQKIYHFKVFKCTVQWFLVYAPCCTAITIVITDCFHCLQSQSIPLSHSLLIPLPPVSRNRESPFCLYGLACARLFIAIESNSRWLQASGFSPPYVSGLSMLWHVAALLAFLWLRDTPSVCFCFLGIRNNAAEHWCTATCVSSCFHFFWVDTQESHWVIR